MLGCPPYYCHTPTGTTRTPVDCRHQRIITRLLKYPMQDMMIQAGKLALQAGKLDSSQQ